MDILTLAVLSLLAIVATTAVGTRLGIAAPLLLTVLGIAVSFLPFVPAITIEPEWILAGVLPPLLYSAAVSMPTMEFRRDFAAISGLSVVLVVISSLILGVMFAWLIEGLGLAGGIALGAIISPTDAVAVSIVKRLGVSHRIIAMLEGESLLNDASALIMLRAALAGMAATVSLWEVAGNFAYAVAVAAVIGLIVGEVNLRVRSWVEDATVNTALSFTIPFLAAIPAEHLGASGLVAAVVAGLVTGRSAPRFLSPSHRLSDSQNWRTIEFVLEGGVFLIMGLELWGILQDLDNASLGFAIGIAALALFITVVIRAVYVTPLLAALKAQSQRGELIKPTIAIIQDRLSSTTSEDASPDAHTRWLQRFSPQQLSRYQTRLRRQLADINYFLAEPLGKREGTVVVWAGMRGVVTLAAAQTLPETMPNRSLLILIAFLVAAGSLLLQGGTLPWLVRKQKLAATDTHASNDERVRLRSMLNQAALDSLEGAAPNALAQQYRERLTQIDDDFETTIRDLKGLRLRVLEAQRNALLDARDDGEFSAEMLSNVLENLDANQISLELKGGPV